MILCLKLMHEASKPFGQLTIIEPSPSSIRLQHFFFLVLRRITIYSKPLAVAVNDGWSVHIE